MDFFKEIKTGSVIKWHDPNIELDLSLTVIRTDVDGFWTQSGAKVGWNEIKKHSKMPQFTVIET